MHRALKPILATLIVLLFTVNVSAQNSSNRSITSFVGVPTLDGSSGYAWNAQTEIGLHDSYDLFPGEYFLIHTQFISANHYATDWLYRFGLTGLFAGAAVDINGAIPENRFAMMPAFKLGLLFIQRDLINPYLDDSRTFFGPRPSSAQSLVGAFLVGGKLQKPFGEFAQVHMDLYVGGMQGLAVMLEMGADIYLRDDLALSLAGQGMAVMQFNRGVYDYSEGPFSSSNGGFGGGGAWVLGFAGLTYQF
jgi:hypothetical protein